MSFQFKYVNTSDISKQIVDVYGEERDTSLTNYVTQAWYGRTIQKPFSFLIKPRKGTSARRLFPLPHHSSVLRYAVFRTVCGVMVSEVVFIIYLGSPNVKTVA